MCSRVCVLTSISVLLHSRERLPPSRVCVKVCCVSVAFLKNFLTQSPFIQKEAKQENADILLHIYYYTEAVRGASPLSLFLLFLLNTFRTTLNGNVATPSALEAADEHKSTQISCVANTNAFNVIAAMDNAKRAAIIGLSLIHI